MGKQAEVTMKNTKDVIFGAYQEALDTIESLKKAQHNPVADAKAKKDAVVVESAKEIRELSIGEVVAKLKGNIGTILNEVAEGLEGRIEQLNVIDEAIALKQAELKDIHGIEVQANSLAALVNANASLKAQQEADHKTTMATYNQELQDIRNSIAEAKKEYAKQQNAWNEEFDQTKTRAQQEWKYDFGRQKQRDRDELADELAAERKRFEDEVETRTEELDDREEAVELRELAADANESHVKELEQKVASIPTLVQDAADKAAKTAAAEVEKVTAIKIAAAEREANLKISIADAKVESLEGQLTKSNAKVDELQTKLDDAYDKIRQMGIEMVSSKHTEAAYAKMGNGQPQSGK